MKFEKTLNELNCNGRTCGRALTSVAGSNGAPGRARVTNTRSASLRSLSEWGLSRFVRHPCGE